MKIALVSPTHLPARRANTLQVMKMAQAMAGLGHVVRVAVPGFPSEKVDWDDLAYQYGLQRQFPIEWLPVWPTMRRYDYGLRAVKWARGWGAELIYTRLPQAAALASILGMATIYEVHDFPPEGVATWLLRRFAQGRGARRLVCITRALAADLADRLGVPDSPPFTVIAPDGVDLERYDDLPEPQRARQMLVGADHDLPLLQSYRFVAGYSGHLYAGRGVELILDMAARLPEVGFLVVGGEPDESQALRSEVKSRRLENVIPVGFVPNAELPRYQASCDLFLMPYQRRVAASSGGDIARYLSPMKLFEYMACGRPILCSDLPVLREVLSPEIAVLLPPDDVEAWVAAIQFLLNDPARCRSLGELVRAEAKGYTWEARASQILEGIERKFVFAEHES